MLIRNIESIHHVSNTGEKVLKGKAMENLPVTSDAWILLEEDKIKDYGKMESCPNLPGVQTIDAKGGLVIPAWCDSHTHLVFAQSREGEFEDRIKGLTYQEIAERGGGILNSADKLRQMEEDELFDHAWERLQELVSMGTGAIEIKSGYGLDKNSELKMLRVIRKLKDRNLIPLKSTLLAAHAVPLEFKGNKDGYVNHIINDILPEVANENLADYIDIFCEKGYFDLKDTDLMLEAGSKYGLRPKIHVNQFNAFGGVQKAIEHNALSVDHLEVVNDVDVELLKQADTIVTALPSCSFFLKIPYTPARKLIDSNIAFSLATDFNPGSTPSGNMNFVMSLACIQMNMTPNEALAAGTLNGAAALELSDLTGSLEKGKLANLIITKPASSLAYLPYNFGQSHIDQVIIHGNPI